MAQAKLFWEDSNEAVRDAIGSSSKTFKEVAHHLWPALNPESAKSRLSGALSPQNPTKLEFDEIAAICIFCERYDPLYYLADRLSHARPLPRAPEDRQAELMREFNERVDRLDKIKTELQQSFKPQLLAAVK